MTRSGWRTVLIVQMYAQKDIIRSVNWNGVSEMKAIGLKFADRMRRRGDYLLRGSAPYINGYEGAGIVIGSNNAPGFRPGDRVAFADVPLKGVADLVLLFYQVFSFRIRVRYL